MTELEIIRALKQNKEAFGLMPVEMQEWARKTGKQNFMYYHGGWRWNTPATDSIFCEAITFRLRLDYPEEPDRIELEIKTSGYLLVISMETQLDRVYTTAPALIPKEGYKFAGYRYNHCSLLRREPFCILKPDQMSSYNGSSCSARYTDTVVVFPVAAVYERVNP